MKLTTEKPFADPEACRLMQYARAFEPIQDGRIYIENVDRGAPEEYSAGLAFAIERGWIKMHESGTFVRFEQAGNDLFS